MKRTGVSLAHDMKVWSHEIWAIFKEVVLKVAHLSQLHEFPDLCHPGQEPLVDLQGLLTVALLHLEVFLCENRFRFVRIRAYVFKVSSERSSKDSTDLIGWWFHRCRMQTFWPGPWRGAEMRHWWSHCSAPWDEPERRKEGEKLLSCDAARVCENIWQVKVKVWLTSNSRSVSIRVCRTGMPFNSFSVVMVLITPSALKGYEVKTLDAETIAETWVGHKHKFSERRVQHTPSWLWWNQKPSGGRRRLSRSGIVHTVWWM